MTPFEITLDNDLKNEARRFGKWLFAWHNLNIEKRVVDVDDFDGGRIHIGGVAFGGSTQLVYWETVRRYLMQRVHQGFGRWDAETAVYGKADRSSALKGTERVLRQFTDRIVREAVETDRRLRGGGYPQKVKAFDASRYHTPVNAEIVRLAQAHERLLTSQKTETGKGPLVKRASDFIESFYASNKGLIWLVGVVIAAIGALVKFGSG